MKLLRIIILLFISTAIVYSQPTNFTFQVQLEDLKSELNNEQNDSLQAVLLARITSAYGKTNPDSTIFYGTKAANLSKQNDYQLITLFVLGYIGDAYHSKGNLPAAIEVCLEAIDINESLPSTKKSDAGTAYSTLGDIYTDIGNYSLALSMYSMLFDIPTTPNARLGNAYGHFGRAKVYEKMNKLDSALYELEQSKINFSKSEGSLGGEQFPNIYPVTPDWFNLRAKVFVKQGKISLAIQDLKTTLMLTLKNNQPGHSANSYNDIAKLFAEQESRDSSIYYAKKGLQEAEPILYTGGILAASEILSEQYDSVNPKEALFYLKRANRMRNQLYGADNIQLMKDMITQNEKRVSDLKQAEEAYQNKLKQYLLFSGLAAMLMIAFILYRNNKRKEKANKILQSQKEEIDFQKQTAETALRELKSTQAQLIQSEKMASLGELTAGIAHEIQNPLNFVNNFSEVSSELVHELKEELDKGDINEAKAISDDVIQNLEKINHHGNRASSIVKGMLEHSRTSSGQKELTDINALADEYLRLAYHGLRAKEKDFNAEMVTNFDTNLPKIEVIPQDIGRVLLNLINNAFQAVQEKSSTVSESYQPMVKVSTELTPSSQESLSRSSGGRAGGVLIIITDNGPGIPDSIKDKIFQPFFTTKDTGKGTGLGLSLAYDIVKAHGGELTVKSASGIGSEFIIQLPIS